MTQHSGLCLNSSHTPAQDTQTIHHGRMTIQPHQRIWIGFQAPFPLARPHHLPKVFKVHLMANSRAWRYNPEIIKDVLAPFEESIALIISLNFPPDVELIRIVCPKSIHNDRMVNDQVHRHERINFARVASHFSNGIAHGRQIHNGRNTRKVLYQNTSRRKRDLFRGRLSLHPSCQGFNIFGFDNHIILKAQHIFEQDL